MHFRKHARFHNDPRNLFDYLLYWLDYIPKLLIII